MSKQELRKGYTTGVHACFCFANALESFLSTKEKSICKTLKMDNDDLDVTRGCEIIVSISQNRDELELNAHKQTPQTFTCKNNKIEIYAGVGVGVVTKKGLKIEPNFPAINPVPLKAMRDVFKKLIKNKNNIKLYCTISITDGENIAKQSANSKVGVLGGLSILGTTGFVKPVSSSAYIDSVKIEIDFVKANQYDKLVLTLGNSAFSEAKTRFKEEQIVEIGNFVYDALELAMKNRIKKILFMCGIGKMTKVAQGFKNTHNRFGVIDFEALSMDIKESLHVNIDTKKSATVKGLLEQLDKEKFYRMIENRANCIINDWFKNIDIELEVV
jgi:cobalt-precorrin-5B (C1)-methyltransferase